MLAAGIDSDDMLPSLDNTEEEEEDNGELVAADIISDILSDIFFVLRLDTSEED